MLERGGEEEEKGRGKKQNACCTLLLDTEVANPASTPCQVFSIGDDLVVWCIPARP